MNIGSFINGFNPKIQVFGTPHSQRRFRAWVSPFGGGCLNAPSAEAAVLVSLSILVGPSAVYTWYLSVDNIDCKRSSCIRTTLAPAFLPSRLVGGCVLLFWASESSKRHLLISKVSASLTSLLVCRLRFSGVRDLGMRERDHSRRRKLDLRTTASSEFRAPRLSAKDDNAFLVEFAMRPTSLRGGWYRLRLLTLSFRRAMCLNAVGPPWKVPQSYIPAPVSALKTRHTPSLPVSVCIGRFIWPTFPHIATVEVIGNRKSPGRVADVAVFFLRVSMRGIFSVCKTDTVNRWYRGLAVSSPSMMGCIGPHLPAGRTYVQLVLDALSLGPV